MFFLFLNIYLIIVNNINMKKKILTSVIAFLSGTITGMFGAGGGLILIPLLSLYLNVEEKKTRATTIYIILFYSIVALIFYFKENNTNWSIAIQCIIGGILGSYIGSKILKKINNVVLIILFIVLLVYSGIRFIK